MKKNVLASSVAAALLGLGMVGAAHANNVLVVPYFTAQTEHATLLNIVNTDTVNGKAVKVRFRGAANSDDVFDFQVFLSPGDVWTGNVSKGATGAAQLTTSDASCTKPAKSVLNSTPFVTSRVDSTLSADGKAEQTREGYVEIFTMADIPPYLTGASGETVNVNPLYTAIKHVSGVAPCTGSAWTGLDSTAVRTAITKPTLDTLSKDTTDPAAVPVTIKGLAQPLTGGLFANYTIINVARAGAWDGEATPVAISSVSTIPYWPQIATAAASAEQYTADPLFRADSVDANGKSAPGEIAAGNYDLPDLSTPYVAAGSPADQAVAVTNALAVTSVTNEFLANADIQATTDWVFSMPTRRYSVALDYTTTGTDDGRRFNPALDGLWFSADNTAVSNRLICVSGVTASIRDQEERVVTVTTEVVVSPSNLPADTLFCGEAGVLSINGGAVVPTPTVNASVAVTDLDVPYSAGWITLATPGATAAAGLPVVGQSFSRAAAGDSFFAASWDHRSVQGAAQIANIVP